MGSSLQWRQSHGTQDTSVTRLQTRLQYSSLTTTVAVFSTNIRTWSTTTATAARTRWSSSTTQWSSWHATLPSPRLSTAPWYARSGDASSHGQVQNAPPWLPWTRRNAASGTRGNETTL